MISFNPQIEPGDVFVKEWGKREIVLVVLPKSPDQAKTPYLRIGGGRDSIWSTRRDSFGGRRNPYRYVGTVPEWFLKELMSA